MILAMLPCPLYVALSLWLDRYEAEPPRLLIGAFVWGAAISVFFALLINSLVHIVVASFAGEEMGGAAATVYSAPIVEELVKGTALFILYWWQKDEFDGIIDGIVYAGMIGLGFAMTENILYYGRAMQEGFDGSLGLFVLRGVVSPFAHPLFTGMTGIGLGWAKLSDNHHVRRWAPIGGLLTAMVLHFIWNLSATSGGEKFIAVYLFVMVPALMAVLVLIYFSLKKEHLIVRNHLLQDLQNGTISFEDYESICTPSKRMRNGLRAFRRGGFRQLRAHREYYSVATELAFHRWHVTRSIVTGDLAVEREEQHLALLRELQQIIDSGREGEWEEMTVTLERQERQERQIEEEVGATGREERGIEREEQEIEEA
jgi:RsiW-degrading membrane proteinase PrsW (M82 family)